MEDSKSQVAPEDDDSFMNHQRQKWKSCHGYAGTSQPNVTQLNRAILIDWFFEVSDEYTLGRLTLHRSVCFLDYYLFKEKDWVRRDNFQLIGCACLLLAVKFEEVDEVDIDQFVYISDNSFEHDDLVKKESHVLSVIEWNLCHTTLYEWLEHYIELQKVVEKNHQDVARVMIDLMLLDYDSLLYPPWEIASECLDIVLKQCTEPHSKIHQMIIDCVVANKNRNGALVMQSERTKVYLKEILPPPKKFKRVKK
jgi:hypothetical protein